MSLLLLMASPALIGSAATAADLTTKAASATSDAIQEPAMETAATLPVAAPAASAAAATPDTIPSARQAPASPPSGTRATLTGDWWGLRPRLARAGITFRADYVSESFTVVSGGQRKGTAYTQQLRGGFDLDMDRIAGIEGGQIHVTFNDRRGHSISKGFIGNRLPIQEAYGGLYTKLTELSWEQKFGGDKLDLRVGYFAMGNDLGGISAGCNFVNAAFCAHALSLSGDSDWYNYPNARLGAAVRVKLTDDLKLRTGVYQVDPALGTVRNAFRPWAGHTSGVILPVELEYTPGHKPGDSRLPGSWKLGFYYDSADATRSGATTKVGGRFGFYALAQQEILREGSAKSGRNLAFMAAYTLNPRTSAQITRWYNFGLIQTGTFKGRDEDTLGLAMVHAVLNPRLRRAYVEDYAPDGGMDALPQGETAIELSYGVQVTKWLIVRPDLQYIIEPGAFSYARRGDAVAAGAQIKMQI